MNKLVFLSILSVNIDVSSLYMNGIEVSGGGGGSWNNEGDNTTTGYVSATMFYGNGSKLTNIPISSISVAVFF